MGTCILPTDPIGPLAKMTRPGLCRIVSATAFIIAMFILTGCSESVNLQTGLNDVDANEIFSLLSRSGIDVKKHVSKEGVTLTVNSTDISRAAELMRAEGLPRKIANDLAQSCLKGGMITTPMEERKCYIHGLGQELENTLLQIDNVVAARVHLVLPERIAPGEPIQPSSASVFIKYHPPFDVDTAIPKIRSLVAAGIPGLSGDDGKPKVAVELYATEALTPHVEWRSVGPFIVQADSGVALGATLIGLSVLSLASVALAAWMWIMRYPKIRAFLSQSLAGFGLFKSKAIDKIEPVNAPQASKGNALS